MSPEEVPLGHSESEPGVAESSKFQVPSSNAEVSGSAGTGLRSEATARQALRPTEEVFGEAPKTAGEPPALHQGNGESEKGDGAKLLEELRAVMNRYVVLPPMAAEALALWVVHTYAFPLRNVTVYIGIVSPEKRCGKTTLLTLLGNLANRSLVASNISPSALFRVIEQTQPTLLIDEADTFLQARDELRGILNAGYNRDGAYVVRVASNSRSRGKQADYVPQFGSWTNENVTGNSSNTEYAQYSCWCPKVMATIGRLPDTLADRCIVITMQRKTSAEQCERMRNLNATALRAKCADFVRHHRDAIAKAEPQLPANLNDRAADIWEPLFAIADLAGSEWPELARKAASKLSSGEEEPSLLGYLLSDVGALFRFKQADRLFSRDIVEMLDPFHDRPWEDLRRGREINEWWLGQRLREVGIRSRTMWIGDVAAKGYLLEDFEEAFRRYLPQGTPKLNPDQSGFRGLNTEDTKNTEPSTEKIESAKYANAAKEELNNNKQVQMQAQFEMLMDKLLAAANKQDAEGKGEDYDI